MPTHTGLENLSPDRTEGNLAAGVPCSIEDQRNCGSQTTKEGG